MGLTIVRTKCRYRPVGGHVFVRMVKKDRTRGGIFMPESVEATLCEGEVLVTGPGRLRRDAKGPEDRIAPSVSVGDVIVFTRHAAVNVDDEAPDVFLVGEDSIIAVRANDYD